MKNVVRKHFLTINSTNTWAKEHAALLPRDKITLITADEQTDGRGRFKRPWKSPKGQNIYATFCFFIEKSVTRVENIPQILAISTLQIVEKKGLHPKIKWPNDLLLNGKKFAGILCETCSVEDQLCVILGIGININMPQSTLKEIDQPATSLMVEQGTAFDVEGVLVEIERQFIENLGIFLKFGFDPFLDVFKKCLTDAEGRLRVRIGKEVLEGVFDSISPDGSLNIKLASGNVVNCVGAIIE